MCEDIYDCKVRNNLANNNEKSFTLSFVYYAD